MWLTTPLGRGDPHRAQAQRPGAGHPSPARNPDRHPGPAAVTPPRRRLGGQRHRGGRPRPPRPPDPIAGHGGSASCFRGTTTPTPPSSGCLRAWCDEHEQPTLVESFPLSRDHDGRRPRQPDDSFGGRKPMPSSASTPTRERHILQAARDLGLTVPGDLLVAAVTEDPAYADLTPPVTTVTLHPDRLAAEAVDLLLALLNDRTDVPRQRLVSHDLVIRESTRPRQAPDSHPDRNAASPPPDPRRLPHGQRPARDRHPA